MQVCPSHGHLEDEVDLQKYVLNSISRNMTFSQIVLLLNRTAFCGIWHQFFFHNSTLKLERKD